MTDAVSTSQRTLLEEDIARIACTFYPNASRSMVQAIVEYITFRFHDPDVAIADVWNVEDVKEVRSDLDDKQALRVLQMAVKEMDANTGINWDVVCAWADYLFPSSDE